MIAPRVTLFEAGSHFGGHSHTVDLQLDGVRHGVDTGFLVFNHRTYPRLRALFESLGVPTAPSDMSFSVQVPAQGLEWSGSSLNSVFAQRSNLLRPRFLGMLAQILRFNRLATELAQSGQADALLQPIGDFLDEHRFGTAFRDAYLLPMLGCIWSCPTDQMLRFPVATMIRFCHNHGLLQVSDRPQWMTVVGGSREYVRRIVDGLPDARLNCPVRQVRRTAAGAVVGHRCRQRTFRRRGAGLPHRPEPGAAGRRRRRRTRRARCRALPAERRCAAHRCQRAAAAPAGLGGLELRARGQRAGRTGRGVPALPDQPAAAAALAARR